MKDILGYVKNLSISKKAIYIILYYIAIFVYYGNLVGIICLQNISYMCPDKKLV